MRKLLLLVLLAPLLMAAKPAPDVTLSNPTPSFGETISFTVGNNHYLRGQEEVVFTMDCFTPSPTGPAPVLSAWWYGTQTITIGELPLPPYFYDIWDGGEGECELYVYAYAYHQGVFQGYREVAELEFDVAG